MTKMFLHKRAARRALARGVAALAEAVECTLGPKGMNVILDRPIGTPVVSRDGVTIASEIELPDRFENMGAQVVREVAGQTNEIAGDGTTTAITLANGLVQLGVEALESGARSVDLCRGLSDAVALVAEELKSRAVPARGGELLRSVAVIAATNPRFGALVAEAVERSAESGIVNAEYHSACDTVLDLLDGIAFDRGFVSHHMVTEVETMEAVADEPFILLTDIKIQSFAELGEARAIASTVNRPLVIVAEEIAPDVIVRLLNERGPGRVFAVNPPEYGHWRKDTMDDLAILTGGKVISRQLGGRLEDIKLDDLGRAGQVRASAHRTVILSPRGQGVAIAARREQVRRQKELAPPNIEQDKLTERLGRLSGAAAVVMVGGVTPVEQKRNMQLIEDSINATQAAYAEGVLPGGGAALAHCSEWLRKRIPERRDDRALGMEIVANAMQRPLSVIAENAGYDSKAVLADVLTGDPQTGFDAARGVIADMVQSGVVDPAKVTMTALQNAASVAVLLLTTSTIVADFVEKADPTAGAARGGGAELLGRH